LSGGVRLKPDLHRALGSVSVLAAWLRDRPQGLDRDGGEEACTCDHDQHDQRHSGQVAFDAGRMNPMMYNVAWSGVVPWVDVSQVAQDLLISRVIPFWSKRTVVSLGALRSFLSL
jgi:hypothetical protein